MNLEELPVYSVMESMSEEDKKTYLPGIAFAGIIDYEMQLAQSENPEERDECRDAIDALYLYANNNGVNTVDLQQTVRAGRQPSKLSEEGSFTCKLIIPSSRRPRRNPAGLVTITTIYKTNMTKREIRWLGM